MYPISFLTSVASGKVQNAQSQGYKSFIELKMLFIFLIWYISRMFCFECMGDQKHAHLSSVPAYFPSVCAKQAI